MTDKNNIYDKAFEVLIDEASKLVVDELADETEIPTDEIEYSEEHKARMAKLFDSVCGESKETTNIVDITVVKKEDVVEKKKFKTSPLTKIAAIIAVVIIASSASVMSVEAWRTQFLNYFFDSEAPNTDYDFGDDKGYMYQGDGIILRYVPEGFVVEDVLSTKDFKKLTFLKSEEYFSISVNKLSENASLDTEEGVVEEFKINGFDALLINKDNISTVTWKDEWFSFSVYGNINKELVIKISENIEI